jgi:hypothetical protein
LQHKRDENVTAVSGAKLAPGSSPAVRARPALTVIVCLGAGEERGMSFCLLRTGTSISEFYNDGHHRRHAHISNEDANLLLEFELVQRVSLKLERVLQWKRFPCRAGFTNKFGDPIGEGIEMVLSNKSRWGTAQMDRKFISVMLTWLEHVREREPQSSRTGPRQLGALRRDKMRTFIPGHIQKPKKTAENGIVGR